MKFTANPANVGTLTFNDLGTDIKGVSSQEKNVRLDAGESIYLPDQSGVLYSATVGDAKRYAAAGKLTINEIILNGGAPITAIHNFNIVPTVSCAKLVGGAWVTAAPIADYTVSTNAALTTTIVTRVCAADLYVRIS